MRHAIVALAVVAASSVAPAWAQEQADQHRTAVSVIGGLSVGSSRSFGGNSRFGPIFGGDSSTGFAVGGGLAHDISPRFTVEASGLYLDRGVSAWSADAGLRVNLTPSSKEIVPYFAVSGGLYGQSVQTLTDVDRVFNVGDLRDGRGLFVGGNPQTGRGQPGRPGGRVLDIIDLAGTALTTRSSSTDGMLTLGGGVRIAAGPHVFVRPDVRAQVVFAGDNRVLGLFTLNFGYRF